MKTRNIFWLILLFVLMNSREMQAQQNSRFPGVEQFALYTDRSIYAAGENIAFAAFQLTDKLSRELISKVLYVELISPQADQLSAGKFMLGTRGAQGKLEIPEDLSSGNYYLRAYTKYMRNIGPEAYTYVPLKILNPDLPFGDFSVDSVSFLQLTKVQDDRMRATNLPIDTIFAAKDELVNLIPGFHENLTNACVSVVPANSLSGNYYTARHKQHFSQVEYIAETRGLSISGLLKNSENDSVIAGARIKLSIIGNGRDFLSTETNEDGRFLFALPEYNGRRDLFVCTENSLEKAAELLIDNDYCRIPVQLPDTVFALNKAEKAVALRLINNQRIAANFYGSTLVKDTFPAAFNKAFYGTPSEIVRLSNYVELPNLEEYFNELPTLAKVRKKQGKKYFKVLSNNAEIPVFEPLVMVDQVAIDNTEAVLAVSPKQIERIEIINAPYIKGAYTYGGIIHLISKEGYFADIDLPENGLFLDYQFFTPEKIQLENKEARHENPEAANTIYWDPEVTNSDLEKGISFKTPSLTGYYELVVAGVTPKGRSFSAIYILIVE